jgi:uncharacterized membrane protein YeaQ/YmgE (transglycosylase-associated protein family)
MSEPFIPSVIIAKLSPALAGALGGLVSFLVDPRLHWRDGIVLIVIGGICSYYLAPSLVHYFNLTQDISNFLSFFTGIVARAVLVRIKEKSPELIVNKLNNIIK